MDMTNILPLLRVRIGLPPEDTSKDPQLTEAWNTSMAMAETYCDRKFDYVADEEEEFTYEADKTISLMRYPLESITSVITADGTDHSMLVDPIRFDKKTGIVYLYGVADDADLSIVYSGGYQTLPPDLVQAMLYVFDAVWSNSGGTGGGGSAMTPSGDIKSISVPDVGRIEFETQSYTSSTSGVAQAWGMIPAVSTAILSLYRREFV